MIYGRIGDPNLAWIPISVQSGRGDWRQLHAIIDTGFTGELALPERFVIQLDLTLNDEIPITPATGQTIRVPVGNALILWRGNRRLTRTVQSGTHPLVGMAPLWNNHVAIDAVTDGAVSVTPLVKDPMGG